MCQAAFAFLLLSAGDAWVDWVGMSSFHFGGESYPYTQNQQAAPNAFADGVSQLTSPGLALLPSLAASVHVNQH